MQRPPIDEILDILHSLSSFDGYTTADGVVGGSTLICSGLIGSNDFITNKMILIESGARLFEDSGATLFNPATGEITVGPTFSGTVLSGVRFFIMNAVSPSRAGNVLAAGIAAILAAIATGGGGGLCYRGIVTAIPVPGQFTIPTLAGLGAGSFIDLSGVSPYHAFVKTDSAGGGAPPQGEHQPITGYATLTGNFVAAAFTVPIAAGDEVLIIHPFLARIMNFAGLPGTNGNLAANWFTNVFPAESTLVTIGAPLLRAKLHMLTIGIGTMVGNVNIRAYMDVNGVETQIFPPKPVTWNVATDAPGVAVINGTIGLRNALRVTVQSDNAFDDMKVVSYDYLIEAM